MEDHQQPTTESQMQAKPASKKTIVVVNDDDKKNDVEPAKEEDIIKDGSADTASLQVPSENDRGGVPKQPPRQVSFGRDTLQPEKMEKKKQQPSTRAGRVSFAPGNTFGYSRNSDRSHNSDDKTTTDENASSNHHPVQFSRRPNRKKSTRGSVFARSSMVAFKSFFHKSIRPSGGRRTAFASAKEKSFRISQNPTQMKAERVEAFFYNHGMEMALAVLFLALNVVVAAHGVFQFTEIGGFITDDDILRVTLPIARAGGRLVTLNCALLLLTACKFLWTWVRTYVAPVIPIGFPIDNIMPKYHSYAALSIIVSGCIIHTLPQIVNYATKRIIIDDGKKIWTFGDGFATRQLLITGILLACIFSTFFLTTRKAFRKTAAGFRWFWAFHVGGIASVYPLLIMHGTCRGYPVFLYAALLPLMLYLFDVAMRRSNATTTNVLQWKTHDDEGQQITELIVECPPDFVYTPGQYAELKFLPISSTEWHPFTIASAPDDKYNDSDTQKLIFCIKATGRWTDALYNYACAFDLTKAKSPTKISIRGPHGAPAMNYFEYKHIVVIGSGIGVTPLLSIWKYLVRRGRTMVYNRDKSANSESALRAFNKSIMGFSGMLGFDDSSSNHSKDPLQAIKESIDDNDDDDDEENDPVPEQNIYSICIVLQKILESMTVSMFLLLLFVLGETTTVVLQMFGFGMAANSLGSALSLIALIVHGSTVIVSTIALGWCDYFKLFKCWLECAIIFVDSFALWISLKNCMMTKEEQDEAANMAYMVFFGVVVALHAVRIFHIFYMTLKPKTTVTNNSSNTPSVSDSHHNVVEKEICSIEGILINRKYSNMRFAARSLLPSIIEDGLSSLFSMEFYGTREKAEEVKKSESRLITHMMGSAAHGLDIKSAMSKHQHDDYFHPGRPDWNKIFLRAMARAHLTNPEGESVGVFFCGSPGIANDLQVAAAKVTAQHQFAVKHLDGKACSCKVIVHSENF